VQGTLKSHRPNLHYSPSPQAGLRIVEETKLRGGSHNILIKSKYNRDGSSRWPGLHQCFYFYKASCPRIINSSIWLYRYKLSNYVKASALSSCRVIKYKEKLSELIEGFHKNIDSKEIYAFLQELSILMLSSFSLGSSFCFVGGVGAGSFSVLVDRVGGSESSVGTGSPSRLRP